MKKNSVKEKLLLKMGGWFSSSKEVENTGTVVNELTIQPATIENKDILILLYIITGIAVFYFVIDIYKMWRKNIKKQYLQRAEERRI